jgi:heme exporter protein A
VLANPVPDATLVDGWLGRRLRMTEFSGTGIACIRGERLVFAGLAFRIERGGALVLVGPNGSGKSSLLRIMAGLTRPDVGTLRWDGLDILVHPDVHRARVHYVGHADAVKPALSVLENLRFWAALLSGSGQPTTTPAATPAAAATNATGAAPGAAEVRARRAMDALGIGHLADVPGRFLSAGQRRRVSLARIVAVPAPLWLLDEPRTALDADASRRLDEIVAAHRDAGGMVAISLHAGERPQGAAVLDLAAFSADQQAFAAPW